MQFKELGKISKRVLGCKPVISAYWSKANFSWSSIYMPPRLRYVKFPEVSIDLILCKDCSIYFTFTITISFLFANKLFARTQQEYHSLSCRLLHANRKWRAFFVNEIYIFMISYKKHLILSKNILLPFSLALCFSVPDRKSVV